jgi:hypothetical protein
MWMAKNSGEDVGIERVTQARYEGEQDEEAGIEDEKNDGDDLEPVAIVRELMEQDGHDASGHCNYKPSVANKALNQRVGHIDARVKYGYSGKHTME